MQKTNYQFDCEWVNYCVYARLGSLHLFSNSDAILKFQFGAMHAGLSRVVFEFLFLGENYYFLRLSKYFNTIKTFNKAKKA
jgi:hypothetical protein